MKVELIEETSVRKALSFEIEPELVAQEIESRAREYARKAKLPGFRPGKVPPEVAKKRFKAEIQQDVAEILVNRVVFAQLEERGLRPLAAPRVADLKIADNQPMTFRAVFETLPVVELPEYKGLPAKARKPQVGDVDVEAELGRLREQAARYDPVEGRAAAKGDFALLDVAWTAEDGSPRRDESALIEVGSEDNHADLNAGLEGMSPGETKQVELSYPEDHANKALAGKSIPYALTLKGVKLKLLPALDDEFAKDLGEFGSLEELRSELRKRLTRSAEADAERELRNELVKALVQRASFEVPEALVERHMDARTEGAARSLLYQGIDPRRVKLDWAKYRESQREAAVDSAKAEILLDEIARREKLEVHEAELEAEIARMAEGSKKSPAALRAQLDKDGDLAAVRARLREQRTLDLLRANARLEFE